MYDDLVELARQAYRESCNPFIDFPEERIDAKINELSNIDLLRLLSIMAAIAQRKEG